jgi:hypothetical protein
VGDLKDAAQYLRDAANKFQKMGGNQTAQDASWVVKSFLGPATESLRNAKRIINDQYGINGNGKAVAESNGVGDPSSALRNGQHEMIRRLVDRQGKVAGGISDPTSPRETKPPRHIRVAQLIGKRWGRQLAQTKFGRQVRAFGKTKVGGKVLGGVGRLAGGAGGAEAGAAGAARGAAAVPVVGWVVAALVLVGTALYAFGKRVTDAADKQLEALRKYEKVSPSVASVFAQADQRDTIRNMERGERLAPSAQSLSNADQKLKDNSTEIVVLVEGMKNGLLTFLENNVADVLSVVNKAAKAINLWFGNKDDEAKLDTLDQFLDRAYADAVKARQKGDEWHQAARR